MGWLSAHLAVVLVSALAVATALAILRQRRAPQSALAWLLFLLVVPYLAIPAFLVFGSRQGPSPRAAPLLDPAGSGDGVAPAAPLDGMARSVDALLRRSGQPAAQGGNRLRFLDGGEAGYAALMEMVASAQSGIDVSLYALGDDPVGRAFVAALEAAAARGVSVRVILDEIGAWRRPRAALKRMRRAGGRLHLFSPLLPPRPGGWVNLRNHRKMVIVDGARLFAGGMNVGARYMGVPRPPGCWRDVAFTATGPVVASYAQLFERDWAGRRARAPDVPPPLPSLPPVPAPHAKADGGATLGFIASGPDLREDVLHDVLVHATHVARRRVWIVTPYFIPTMRLFDALALACRRGIDLRILVPERSNHLMADLARGSYLRDLQSLGARIFLLPGPMIHAKGVILDDMGMTGSANLDVRSLLLNHEVMVLLHGAREVEALSGWMVRYMRLAHPRLPGCGPGRLLGEGLLRLAAPVL